ncbi:MULTISPECIES: ring-cleaving dioxygenase [unclassified Enterococcus]|uniref:ring-cleaving dioxygenase n=1 Tax=unclassified Enterococcus TaxID=2608891 RepID=UPI001556ABB1|nr:MULTISPECIES: ring-cleaving dioxygenase [unclassified Enterococcus]MBS7577473.1 ring-cleaving dioxygenase [Enterococcus sp. MMGLQ5-2]MBS7584879.1 ring-cleaving dioxygenase [Enterococcus sp. MMGLQ5-1]NPD12734.1 ring-cleaving dioxygenase [Enterococcus sp. MMGLQ5-1]NPD37305.1 ring-cleaving dioxygenase [Enterococcus sp. MMGLQ5-2]
MANNELYIKEQFQLKGIHHVTAITSSAQHIYEFFSNILGLQLAKVTVNQDDYQTYHLYFTDENGAAGTDMTFFDFPNIPKGSKGTNSIQRTSFRVPSNQSLVYWQNRFNEAGIKHQAIQMRFDKQYLEFEDFDGQQYQLISDENNLGVASGQPWKQSNVSLEHAITGLGPVFVAVNNLELITLALESVLGFRKTAQAGNLHLYEVGLGGNGGSIIIEEDTNSSPAIEGYGSIHHLALRVKDQEGLNYWINRLKSFRLPQSGLVDRFYFQSEYFRVAPQILFEIATDGPGFWVDEAKEKAGLQLSLPPHLFPDDEATKAQAAAKLRPLDTADARSKRTVEWKITDIIR